MFDRGGDFELWRRCVGSSTGVCLFSLCLSLRFRLEQTVVCGGAVCSLLDEWPCCLIHLWYFAGFTCLFVRFLVFFGVVFAGTFEGGCLLEARTLLFDSQL